MKTLLLATLLWSITVFAETETETQIHAPPLPRVGDLRGIRNMAISPSQLEQLMKSVKKTAPQRAVPAQTSRAVPAENSRDATVDQAPNADE